MSDLILQSDFRCLLFVCISDAFEKQSLPPVANGIDCDSAVAVFLEFGFKPSLELTVLHWRFATGRYCDDRKVLPVPGVVVE